MTQTQTGFSARSRLQVTGIFTLVLSACTQAYIGEPWTHNDAQWKQAHFASQTPDEALRERAALTQRDR
jgi:hypothetical protein